jgi:hypothetical protein
LGVRFSCGFDESIFSVGPSKQRRDTRVLSRRAGSSGFEPQRALSFRNWVKAPQIFGESAQA